jgi:hypothetical protein
MNVATKRSIFSAGSSSGGVSYRSPWREDIAEGRE